MRSFRHNHLGIISLLRKNHANLLVQNTITDTSYGKYLTHKLFIILLMLRRRAQI